MITSYQIILKCSNPKDEERFGRTLYINNYESAVATFRVIAKSALEEMIDPYTIEFYYPGRKDHPDGFLRYKLEGFKE